MTPQFQDKLGLMVIDEFHLVDQWGRAFRKEYAKLKRLRCSLPARVPWFACSATLDELTLAEARLASGFRRHTFTMRTEIDRPEIFLRVAEIPPNTLASFAALNHIVEPAVVGVVPSNSTSILPSDSTGTTGFQPARVRKTIVFMETRDGCGAAAEALKLHLKARCGQHCTNAQLDRMIKVYHGKTSKISQ